MKYNHISTRLQSFGKFESRMLPQIHVHFLLYRVPTLDNSRHNIKFKVVRERHSHLGCLDKMNFSNQPFHN